MLPLEYSCTVYCDQANYVPMSVGDTEAEAKGGKELVGTGWFGYGGYADSSPAGGTAGGGGGDGCDGDKYGRLIKWEGNVANITLGTDTNAPIAYASGLDLYHLIMHTLGVHRGQFLRLRDIFLDESR